MCRTSDGYRLCMVHEVQRVYDHIVSPCQESVKAQAGTERDPVNWRLCVHGAFIQKG